MTIADILKHLNEKTQMVTSGSVALTVNLVTSACQLISISFLIIETKLLYKHQSKPHNQFKKLSGLN